MGTFCGDARVVDPDIDPAEAPGDGVALGADIGDVADVQPNGFPLDAVAADLFHDRRSMGEVDVRDHHGSPVLGELQRDTLADAPAATRDNRHLVLQQTVHVRPLLSAWRRPRRFTSACGRSP